MPGDGHEVFPEGFTGVWVPASAGTTREAGIMAGGEWVLASYDHPHGRRTVEQEQELSEKAGELG